MPSALPYLLRTPAQIEWFRSTYAELIREKSAVMRDWFNALPLYEWVRLQFRGGQEMATVGLLCHLYLEGEINVTFSRDGNYIQRGAMTLEEHEAWAVRRFLHIEK